MNGNNEVYRTEWYAFDGSGREQEIVPSTDEDLRKYEKPTNPEPTPQGRTPDLRLS